MTANFTVHIDRLVLDGLGHLDGDAVGAAVEAELTRLFTERGVTTRPAGDQYVPWIEADQMAVSHDVADAEAGAAIAGLIHGALAL